MTTVPELRTETLQHCPLCSHDELVDELQAQDHIQGTGAWSIVRCCGCGVRLTNPRPIEEDLPLLYEDRVFDSLPQGRSPRAWLRARRAQHRLRRVASELKRSALRVADVGAGDGFFAHAISELPQCSAVVASDMFDTPPTLISQDPRPKLRYQGLDAFFADEERYDVIFCRFIFEHLPWPRKFTEQLTHKLNPGGQLIIDVPNWNSVWRVWFGDKYSALGLPQHLIHYTPEGLKALLRDFEDVEVRENVHGLILGRSLGNRLGRKIPVAGSLALGLFGFELLVDTLTRRPAAMTGVGRLPG